MRSLNIFLYEWKHFVRSPFKIVALLLFIVASIYGLHNGADLYKKQNAEITRLNKEVENDKATVVGYFDKGEKGPKNRSRVDVSMPFWSIWYTPTYYYKTPSPAIVYNIGQAEHYGFYKKINIYSSPYDVDMTKEIANPERIQSGTLDFSFVVLFLMPLLLLVLLYNIKGFEGEQGFLPLVFVQTGSRNWWIISRTLFYTILFLVVIFALMLYGATLTPVFKDGLAFWTIFMYINLYLLFWIVIYFLILKYGKNIISNTLQMVGIWLLFAFIIPAAISQWVSITKPANLMIDLIDTKRDKTDAIYELSDTDMDNQIFSLYPKLKQTKIMQDTIPMSIKRAKNYTRFGLINVAMKTAVSQLETDNTIKNELISKTYWFNPLTYFQNVLNRSSKTHYNDYQTYRNDIQNLVDKRIKVMVFDIWNTVKVDKAKYLEYNETLNK